LVLILSLGLNETSPQVPESSSSRPAFRSGEELSYDIKYQWGGLWTRVAKVRFSVDADTLDPRTPVYHFQGKGRTLTFYDAFFKVRDLYRSTATQEGLHPVRFHRKVREGGTRLQEIHRFDRERKLIYRRSTQEEGIDTIPYQEGAMDVLTAIYRCRSMKLEGMRKGDSVELDLVLGKKVHPTHFVYRGKEEFQHPNGKSYNCHFIEPELIPGSIFEEGDRMKVLVTDDRRKLPVYVKSEILVGEVKVYLSGAEGTIDP
jgi:hypothetical protein